MDIKQRAAEVAKRLGKLYSDPHSCLSHSNPFELLVATILSAQTTDVHVNKVTPGLFARYRTIEAFAAAPPAELQKALSSVNFYNNKAKSIRNSARMILEEFGGKVPQTMPDLIRLPGVARKTANIILYDAFGKTEGMAVDTHVKRLANRLGFTTFVDPAKIEQDLMRTVAKKDWGRFSHMLVLHGRAVCQARTPLHEQCVLADICPSSGVMEQGRNRKG